MRKDVGFVDHIAEDGHTVVCRFGGSNELWCEWQQNPLLPGTFVVVRDGHIVEYNAGRWKQSEIEEAKRKAKEVGAVLQWG